MRLSFAFPLALVLALAAACAESAPDAPVAAPGDPLPGLTEAQTARFQEGRRWFDYRWTPEEGLGPLYVQDRCSSCHDLPELGGTGVESLSLMSHYEPAQGRCDDLEEEGGAIQQERATPLAQAAGILRESVPAEATERAREVSPLLYGLGLIEAIPEAEITSRADPDDADGDGISGRFQRAPDGRLGRLLRKANVPSILDLVRLGFATELGLTSPGAPDEQTLNGTPLPAGVDPVPDPDVDDDVLASVADFIRFLAPPAPEEPASAAARDSIAEGSRLFDASGCASCHVPAMETGPNEVAALDHKTIYLYSDLLLHDMGSDARSICAGEASPTEFRTARLLGLRYREAYSRRLTSPLSLEQTILAHGGEAQESRDAFAKLNTDGRRLVIRFLMSL